MGRATFRRIKELNGRGGVIVYQDTNSERKFRGSRLCWSVKPPASDSEPIVSLLKRYSHVARAFCGAIVESKGLAVLPVLLCGHLRQRLRRNFSFRGEGRRESLSVT